MANEINNSQQPKKSRKKWLWILGIGLFTTGLSVFGYQYWKKNKQTDANNSDAPDFKATKPKVPIKNSVKPSTKDSTKPSGKGGSTPPKGKQAPPTAKPIDAKTIAKYIHAAVLKKDFTKVYEQLRNVRNTKDYSAVSKVFSTMFVAGVRQTLVNGLLNTFKDPKQKDTLKKSFNAMGLKFDGKKWSLSGVEQAIIITTATTRVWKDPKTAVAVPINMVLGKEVCQRGNFTLFENDKQYFLVETKAVKPYSS